MSSRSMLPKGIGHIHLDPLGGIAGDMFAAAVLDAFPALEAPLAEALAGSGAPAGYGLRRIPIDGHGLAGSRIEVLAPEALTPSGHLSAILDRLAGSDLAPAVRTRAAAIYRLLAEAEGRVHGVPPEQVHFHELADWDSYLDIVAAAWLIEILGARSWSTAPLPLGRGRIRTAHGMLPVPAPATALLLRGLPVHDDGIEGERVTPTGAAILRHLAPTTTIPPGTILATGHGFGTSLLDGVPNLLRLLAFSSGTATTDQVGVLRFEIDDQTGEDLAIGIDRLRELEGVLDVVQAPVFGKKGRIMTHVRILARPDVLDAVVSAAFDETTTIGIRHRIVERSELRRMQTEVEVDGSRVRLKSAERPGGPTCKAEADDIAPAGDRPAREALRRAIEALAEDQ
jgi:uncharacterized protein (TIGR00299 family) protein